MGPLAHVLLLAGLLAPLTGCGPAAVRSEYHQRTTLTKAMAPVPQPPVLDGPLPEPERLATEAWLSYGRYLQAPFDYASDGPATWVPSWHGRARLSYGLTPWMEAGLGFGFSGHLAGQPLMTGLSDEGLDGASANAVFALRAMAPLDAELRLGGVLEAGGWSLPTRREVIEETSVDWDDDYGPWFTDYDTSTSTARSIRVWYGVIRGGPQLAYQAAEGWYVSLGALLTSHPFIRAVRVQEWSCSWTEEQVAYDCPGPDEPSFADHALLFEPTISVSAPTGPLRLQAQLFAAMPPVVLGATLSLRADIQAE